MEIKRCLYCGEHPTIKNEPDWSNRQSNIPIINYNIYCWRCNTSNAKTNLIQEMAIDSWNRREVFCPVIIPLPINSFVAHKSCLVSSPSGPVNETVVIGFSAMKNMQETLNKHLNVFRYGDNFYPVRLNFAGTKLYPVRKYSDVNNFEGTLDSSYIKDDILYIVLKNCVSYSSFLYWHKFKTKLELQYNHLKMHNFFLHSRIINGSRVEHKIELLGHFHSPPKNKVNFQEFYVLYKNAELVHDNVKRFTIHSDLPDFSKFGKNKSDKKWFDAMKLIIPPAYAKTLQILTE